MTTDFWSFQPKSVYNQRKAKQFLEQANLGGAGYLARVNAKKYGVDPGTVNQLSSTMDSGLLDAHSMNQIQPSQPQSKSLFKTIGLSPIDQPWDVLRPIARLFEAENKYIAHPAAKALYEGAIQPGADLITAGAVHLPDEYDKLPGVVKIASESLLSPSTWIAPETSLKLLRFSPKLAAGLPAIGSTAPSLGSRAGIIHFIESQITHGSIPSTAAGAIAGSVGSVLAPQIGLPSIVGSGLAGAAGYAGVGKLTRPRFTLSRGDVPKILSEDDMTLLHGTAYDYQGLPSGAHSGDAHSHSIPGAVYASPNPDVANAYAGDYGADRTRQVPPSSRVIPMILKKGTKYFDTSADQWPVGFQDVESKIKADPYAQLDYELTQPSYGMSGTRRQNQFTNILKKQGYSAIKNGDEVIIFDQGALQPMWTRGGIHKIVTGQSENSDYNQLRQSMQSARTRLQTEPDLSLPSSGSPEQTYRDKWFGGKAPPIDTPVDWTDGYSPKARDLGDDLQDSLDAINLMHKPHESWTSSDILRADELLARRSARGYQSGGFPGMGILGPDNMTKDMQKMYDRVNSLPDSEFQLRTPEQIQTDMASRKSISDLAKEAIDKYAPPWLSDYVTKKGLRLFDDDTSLFIKEYARLKGVGLHTSNSGADQIRGAVHNLDKLGTLQRLGLPDYESLISNVEAHRPSLTPQEGVLVDAITTPIAQAISTAEAAGVPGVPKASSTTGHFVSLQAASERPVASRLGGKQPTTLTSPYASRAEMAGAGIEPRDFINAQQAFLTQMYQSSADKWLNTSIAPMGKSLTELLPQDVLKSQQDLGKIIGRFKQFDKALSDAIKTSKFAKPNQLPESLQPLLAKALIAAKKGKQADRRAGYAEVRKEAAGVLQNFRTANKDLQAKLKYSRETILRQGGTTDYNTAFNNRYYPEAAGRQLQNVNPKPTSDFIQSFNQFSRPFIATLDASFLGINGLLGLARNPNAYYRAVLNAFSSDSFDVRVAQSVDSGVMNRFLAAGGAWQARNDLGEFLFKGASTKLPGATTANTWFTRFGNAMRLNLFEGSLPLAQTLEDEKSLMHTINLATGVSSNPASRVENIALFAPRFFRSQLGLLSDAVTGGTSPSKLGATEARKMLFNLVGGGVALTYGANHLLGNKTDTDPTSPNFMRIRFAGQDVSLFGPWDTLLRAASNSFKNGIHPEAGLTYLARSKASPAVSRLLDVIHGEDFSGDKINFSTSTDILNSMYHLFGQTVEPITVQNFLQTAGEAGVEAFKPNTYSNLANPELLGGAAVQALGTKASPISARERRDMLALDHYNTHWRGLEPYQKNQLQQQFPDVAAIRARTDDEHAQDERRAISLRYANKQQELDDTIPVGKDWVDAYHDLKREQSGAFDQWEQTHLELANRLNSSPATSAGGAALESYYSIFRQSKTENWTPEELSNNLDALESGWSSEQKAYVQRNTGLHDTDTVKEYKKAQTVLRPYFAIQDQVWDRVSQNPSFAAYDSLDEYVKTQADTLVSQGIPQVLVASRIQRMPIVQKYQSTVSDLRERYRHAHPEADAELVRWYGAVPIRLQR